LSSSQAYLPLVRESSLLTPTLQGAAIASGHFLCAPDDPAGQGSGIPPTGTVGRQPDVDAGHFLCAPDDPAGQGSGIPPTGTVRRPPDVDAGIPPVRTQSVPGSGISSLVDFRPDPICGRADGELSGAPGSESGVGSCAIACALSWTGWMHPPLLESGRFLPWPQTVPITHAFP